MRNLKFVLIVIMLVLMSCDKEKLVEDRIKDFNNVVYSTATHQRAVQNNFDYGTAMFSSPGENIRKGKELIFNFGVVVKNKYEYNKDNDYWEYHTHVGSFIEEGVINEYGRYSAKLTFPTYPRFDEEWKFGYDTNHHLVYGGGEYFINIYDSNNKVKEVLYHRR